MAFRARIAAAFALLALGLAAPLAAQVPADQIDQRVRDVPPSAEERRAEEDEAILTGRDDILLLEKRKFFTIFASAGPGFTDNAALSPTARREDGLFTADAGIRIATRLGGKVDVFAEAGASTTRYFKETDLDFVAGFGAVGAHVRLAGFDLDAAYTPTLVYDGDVEDRQLTQHRFVVGIGRGARIGKALVRAAIGGERIEANPSAFQNFSATATLSGFLPVARRVSLLGSARGVRRWYDNYFEGLLGVERRDWFVEGAAGISWQAHRRITVDARATYARNFSTADISRYRAIGSGLMLRTSFRF